MGYISSSFASAVSKNMTLAAKYHINLFSYYSDLVIAARYGPELNTERFDSVKSPWISASVGLSQGLSLLFHGFYKQLSWSAGVFTDLKRKPQKGFHIECQLYL